MAASRKSLHYEESFEEETSISQSIKEVKTSQKSSSKMTVWQSTADFLAMQSSSSAQELSSRKKKNQVTFRNSAHSFNNTVVVKVKVAFKKPRALRRIPVELRVGLVKIKRRSLLEYLEESEMDSVEISRDKRLSRHRGMAE